MNNKVKLEWFECELAAQVGLKRNVEALRRDLKHFTPLLDHQSAWNNHIEGAAGELAFAKWVGHYWSGSVNTFKVPDVGSVHVRTSVANRDLIVRPKDDDSGVYVLVRGQIPEFEIIGWVYGHEAKQPLWLKNPNNGTPCYIVPTSALRSIGSLPPMESTRAA
jgi:hypothetical protein